MTKKNHRIFVWTLVVGLVCFGFILPAMYHYNLYSGNSVSLSEGESFVLKASGPVEALAYATESTRGARLYDEAGNMVLETVPEKIPGNYAGTAVLTQGKYTLEGGSSTIVISGDGFESLDSSALKELWMIVTVATWGVSIILISVAWVVLSPALPV